MDVVVDRCAALGRAPEDGDGMCSSAGGGRQAGGENPGV
jgi:hypothetical protein